MSYFITLLGRQKRSPVLKNIFSEIYRFDITSKKSLNPKLPPLKPNQSKSSPNAFSYNYPSSPSASSYNEPSKPSYTTYNPAPTTRRTPPIPSYGIRVRQRRDFPCDDPAFPQYIRLCENLKAMNYTVECGDRRFR